MSKRVVCSFDYDEIYGYLTGGLPTEVLGWNPDPTAVEGVVESVLQRILDEPPIGEWVKRSEREFKLFLYADATVDLLVVVTRRGLEPTPWDWIMSIRDSPCAECTFWIPRSFATKEAAMQSAEFVVRAILAANEAGNE